MKPLCKLIGTDGNVFAIIGNVSRTLKQADQRDKAKEWMERATSCHSYNEVLNLIGEYVEISGSEEPMFEDCDRCGTVGCDGECQEEDE